MITTNSQGAGTSALNSPGNPEPAAQEKPQPPFFSINSADKLLLIFLLGFSFFIPFSYSNPQVLLSFLATEAAFCLLALWLCHNLPYQPMAFLKQKHHGLYRIFWGWIAIISLSYIVAMLSNPSIQQVMQGSIRFFYNFLNVIFIFTLAKFTSNFAIKHETLILNLCLGSCFMICIQLTIANTNSSLVAKAFHSFPLFIGHIRELGFMALASLAASFSILLFGKQNILKKIMLYCIFLLSSLFVIWAGGRTTAASAIITICLLTALAAFHRRLTLKKASITAILLICAFYGSNTLTVFHWNGLHRTFETVQAASSTLTNKDPQATVQTTGRKEMWTLSLEGVKESPWIGHGPYGYRFLDGWFYGMQPHNIFLQFLIEWGVIGSLLILSMMIYIANIGIRQLGKRIEQYDASYVACLAIIVSLGLNSLTSGAHYNPMPMFFLAIAYSYFPFGKPNNPT